MEWHCHSTAGGMGRLHGASWGWFGAWEVLLVPKHLWHWPSTHVVLFLISVALRSASLSELRSGCP